RVHDRSCSRRNGVDASRTAVRRPDACPERGRRCRSGLAKCGDPRGTRVDEGGRGVGQSGARRQAYARGVGLARAAHEVVAEHAEAVARVRAQAAVLCEREVAKALEAISVARLKDVTEGRLRVAALKAAGFQTVRKVHQATTYDLLRIPG